MMRHDKKIKRCLMELSKKPARNRNSNNIQIWKYNSKRLGQLRRSLVTRPFWVLLKYGSRDENPKRSDTFNTLSDGKNLYMANLPQKPNYPD